MTWWNQFWSDVYHGATAGDIALAGGLVLLALLYVLTRGEFKLAPHEEDPDVD